MTERREQASDHMLAIAGMLEEGKMVSTPWGLTETTEKLAGGIWKVHTQGHGGMFIVPGIHDGLPAEIRNDLTLDCWLEEDFEAPFILAWLLSRNDGLAREILENAPWLEERTPSGELEIISDMRAACRNAITRTGWLELLPAEPQDSEPPPERE